MLHFKLQLGCLLIVLYIAFIYYRERRNLSKININIRKTIQSMQFERLMITGTVCILLDGLTAYFVNNQSHICDTFNRILHLLFFINMGAMIFQIYLYMVSITEGLPKKKWKKCFMWSPFVISVLLIISSIKLLEFRSGSITNYSMGISVYICFAMLAMYIMLTLITFIRCRNDIESRKRVSIFTYLLVSIFLTAYQIFNPEVLITSISVTVIIIGIYMNQENPVIKKLSFYHKEMVMGFATLVENKDNNTGGHIKRTTAYIKLIVEEMKKRGIYKNILTKDYIDNLLLAAPMHDIGKIGVPDAILQKPAKLTDDEFEIMKRHTVDGGKIVQETFYHLGEEQYGKIAYNVARSHHEKWNGKGYPDALKGDQIPLCARIMAIADVFDAVSQNRCYRAAMPLEECFNIISSGRGEDFEPVLVDVFLDIKDRVSEVCNDLKN